MSTYLCFVADLDLQEVNTWVVLVSFRKVEEENEKKYARKDIPRPLQGR